MNWVWPVNQKGLVWACGNGKVIKEYPWASALSYGRGKSNDSVMEWQLLYNVTTGGRHYKSPTQVIQQLNKTTSWRSITAVRDVWDSP